MIRFSKLSKLSRTLISILCVICIVTLCGCSASLQAPDDSTVETKAEEDTVSAAVKEASDAVETSKASEVSKTSSDSIKTSEMITLTDMIGRDISVTPGSYKKVVCIGAGALRMYSYIGDIDMVCGVEDIDNLSLEDRPKMFDSVARPYMLAYDDAFKGLPSCGVGGPNAQAAEAEKILLCEPDIVISEYKDVEKENALQEQLGVPVITVSAGKDGVFDNNFYDSLRLLGTIFEKEARADEIINFVADEAGEISSRTSAVVDDDKPSVYICGLGNWGTTDHLTTAEDFKAFEIANIKNAVSGTGATGPQPIEEEKFVAIGDDIDIMIIDSAAVKNIAPLYQEDNTLLDSCKAWREGNAYLQMAYNAYYTNFELSLINTWYTAKVVYPELFEDIDINKKADEITEMFLGKALSEQINSCPASYGGYQKIDTSAFFAGLGN